jgi:SOS response regulatory protein OraA/RecX
MMKKRDLLIQAISAVALASVVGAGVVAVKKWKEKKTNEIYSNVSGYCKEVVDAITEAMDYARQVPCSKVGMKKMLEEHGYSDHIIESVMYDVEQSNYDWVKRAAMAAEKIDEEENLSRAEMFFRLTMGDKKHKGLGFEMEDALHGIHIACIDWEQNAVNAYLDILADAGIESSISNSDSLDIVISELVTRGFTTDEIDAVVYSIKDAEEGAEVDDTPDGKEEE